MGRISKVDAEDLPRGRDRAALRNRLTREVRASPDRSIASELGIGFCAGLAAALLRLSLPLRPQQLPTLTVVVTLAVVTTFVGVWAGIATALVGGILAWYLFFNPYSWSLANDAWIPLLGFAVIASVIVTTAQLYRSTARTSHEREVARLYAQADTAELFAREMAHRLKNALAIVQALAFQTIGTAGEDAAKFSARLKALADANDLLNEHVDTPSATVAEVIESALAPFGDLRGRVEVASVDALIPSQQVVSLALALHELTTNATKYGALSTVDGRVTINVEQTSHGLCMTWKEAGGPKVSEPQRTGFGTRLLRRSGMNTKLDFEADGLRCSMGLRSR